MKTAQINESNIYELLYRLGLTADSVSFFHTAYAVRLVVEEPERLTLVTKLLYPSVAKRYRTTWRAVERSIRRSALVAWRANPEYLRKLARYRLYRCPTAAKFLAILSANVTTIATESVS